MNGKNSDRDISLGGRAIGPHHPPFIVAEMSGNHNRSLQRGLEIIDAAAAAGVDAVKIQTYTADSMTLDMGTKDFMIEDEKSLWHGRRLYELYQEACTPWEWHEPLFRRCQEQGIGYFSTPFDVKAVDFLEHHDVPFYKIASFENTDLILVKKVCLTGKPVIISTGMATLSELEDLVRVIIETGNKNFILLKCTSSYPADPRDSHTRTIPHLRETFDCQVGLSDHTLGIGASIAAVALGATVIERHFTLSRKEGGVDAAFSLEPEEMKNLVLETRRAWQSLGQVHYGPTHEETASLKFRRSLYLIEDVPAGGVLTQKNLRPIRPGFGLATKFYDLVLGRKVICDVKKGTPLSWDLLIEK